MAPTAVTTMYDTIGRDAGSIPAAAQKVAGYVTGTPDIVWPAAAWSRFAGAGRIRVDQSPDGAAYQAGAADVYDIEVLAGTPARFAVIAGVRFAGGRANCAYGSAASLQAAAAALDQYGAANGFPPGWWHGVSAWLAAPDLTLAEATSLVGTLCYGFTVRAVQWATPRSNPTTEVPGARGNLVSLNLDLSVADVAWFPAPPPPVPWQHTAMGLAESIQKQTAELVGLIGAHQ